MNKIFGNAEEKYLKRVELFATSDGDVLSYDAAGTLKVPYEGLLDLLQKDLVIVNVNDVFQVPVGFKVNGVAIDVYCLDVSSTVAKATYKSSNKIA